VRERVLGELRANFRPEFLNRVDDIVLFKPLTIEEIKRIVDLLLEQLRQRLADHRIALELTDAAREWLAREGYDPVYGARPLKRLLQRELETALGRRLIAGEIHDGATVVVDLDQDHNVLTFNEQSGTHEPREQHAMRKG
jgi:ATP-dependent Clp protease ATP-binding subunit ClpB